jgi:hypothetical protein
MGDENGDRGHTNIQCTLTNHRTGVVLLRHIKWPVYRGEFILHRPLLVIATLKSHVTHSMATLFLIGPPDPSFR